MLLRFILADTDVRNISAGRDEMGEGRVHQNQLLKLVRTWR